MGFLNFHPLQALEAEQLGDAAALDAAVVLNQCGLLASLDRAVVDLADHDAAKEIGIVEGGHLQLQGLGDITNRRRNMAQDRVEQRPHVLTVGGHVGLGETTEATAKQIGEVALVIISTQLDEQIQHLAHGHFGVSPGAVDLVDENNRPQAFFKGLFQHKAGLGHGPLVGINDQQTAVDHAEHALNFTTEVSVTRGINDVDAGVLVINGRVLRQDRDATLTLQVVGVHHAGGHSLAFAEDARLGQQGIHQGGFAMVNVGDDRNVANRGARSAGAHWG